MRSRPALALLLAVIIAPSADAQVRDSVAAPRSTGERTYFEFQVEKPVRQAPGSAPPRYPLDLKAAGVEGEVLVQFVVDSLGMPVLQSFRVLKASAPEFGESVKAALPAMRFVPAEVRGRKVRQLVQQPFVFAIRKDSTATTVGEVRTPTPRPAPPPVSITPPPRSGTVRGWTIERRLSVDSGNGSEVVSRINRRFGTAGRTRFEMEGPARFQLGFTVVLTDSATGRTTLLLPTLKAASVTKTQMRDDAAVSVRFRPRPHGITDLGAGETIASLPTRHYRVTGTTESRFYLGERVCVVAQETATEYWTTTDPTLLAIQGYQRGLGIDMLATSSIPLTGADSGGLSTLGAFLKVVTRNGGPVGDTKSTVTTTSEVLSFSEGTLEASLFEPPEGYQLRDLTSVVPSARSDSVRAVVSKRLFDRLVDTTKVVPGVTTTCTPSKAR